MRVSDSAPLFNLFSWLEALELYELFLIMTSLVVELQEHLLDKEKGSFLSSGDVTV